MRQKKSARPASADRVPRMVTPGGVEPPLPDRKSGVLDRWTMGSLGLGQCPQAKHYSSLRPPVKARADQR